MSTDINTSTSNVSTSTLNVLTLSKRVVAIAMFAVLALLMGSKFSGALLSGPSSGGHASAASVNYYASGSNTTPPAPVVVASTAVSYSAITGQVTVSWTNGGANGVAVTSYTVANPSNSITLCTTTNVGAAGAPNSCSWTPNASNAYAGDVDVFANAAGGVSTIDTVATVNSGTPINFAVLNAPQTPAASPANGYVTVSWAAPSGSNGLSLVNYQVYKGSTLLCTTTNTYCVISYSTAGLTLGENQTFTIFANNAAGLSTAASVSTGVATSPSAPQGLTATVDYVYGSVDLTYTAPATNGGSAISSYSYLINGRTASSACDSGTTTATGATCSILFSKFFGAHSAGAQLSPFTGTVSVVATNAIGSTPATSGVLKINDVPVAPTSLTNAGSTTTSYVANWTASAGSTTGVTPTAYLVQLQTCATTSTATGKCTDSGSPVMVAGGLSTYTFTVPYGSIYGFSVRGVSGAGNGAVAYATSAAYYDLSGGANPSGTTVTVSGITNNSMTVTFTAPAYLNGGTVTGYSLQLVSNTTSIGSPVLLSAAGSYTFTGLIAGNMYGVNVTTATVVGSVAKSATTNSTQYTVGAAQAISLASVGAYTAAGVTFTWTPMSTKYAVSYNVYSTGGALICSAPAGAASCTATPAAVTAAITATGGSSANATLALVDANGVVGVTSSVLGYPGVATFTKVNVTGAAPTVNAIIKNGLKTSATYKSVDVEWTTIPTASSYNVTAIGSDGTQVTGTTTASNYVFPASKLTATSYTFQVQAVGPTGSSAYSTPAAITVTNTTAVAPSAPVVVDLSTQDIVTATGVAGTAHLGTGGALALFIPTAAVNGGVLAVSFYANPAEVISDGSTVTSFTGTLTIATGQALVCTVPASAYQTSTEIGAALFGGYQAGAYAYYYSQAIAGAGTATGTSWLTGAFSGLSTTNSQAAYIAAFTASGLTAGTYGAGYITQAQRIATAAANAFAAENSATKTATIANVLSSVMGVKLYTCTFFGIAANYTNSFSVVANSGLASSAASNTAAIVNTGVSSAPTAVAVTFNSAATTGTVTWTAPASSPSPISGYTVTVTGDDGAGVLCPVTGAATTCSFTNPWADTGVTYTISVVALEDTVGAAPGGGSSPAATITATANDAPSTPTPPTVSTKGNMGVTITWTAPASNGSAITGYVITPSGTTLNTLGTDATKSYCLNGAGTIAGIYPNTSDGSTPAPGTIYVAAAAGTSITCYYDYAAVPYANSYSVTAVNVIGSSYPSTLSTSVTPVHTLAAPGVAQSYLNDDGTLLVMWTPKSGATSYTVTLAGGPALLTYTATGTSFVVPAADMNVNLTYTASVTTNNAAGNSLSLPNGAGNTAAAAADAGTLSAPSLYQYLSSSAATTQTLAWTQNSTTLLPATFTVTGTKSGVTTVLASGLTTTTWTGAYSSLVTYKVLEVTAEASTSSGSATQFVGLVKAATPTYASGSSSTTSTTVVVGWTANENSAGGAPYGFTATLTSPTGTVLACPTLASTWTLTASGASTSHTNTCTWTGLSPNTMYVYSVVENAVSGDSTALTGAVDTLATAPSAPTIVSVVKNAPVVGASSTKYTVTATWTAPASSGTAPLTGYYLTYGSSASPTGASCPAVLDATATSCTFTVSAGASTYVNIVAMNGAGLSSPASTITVGGTSYAAANSAKTTSFTASSTPPTVIGLSVATPTVGTIVATWTDNGAQNAAAVTGFLCTATDGYGNATSVTVGSTVKTCTITGLANSTYTVTVAETNAYAGGSYGTAASTTAYPIVSNAFANFGAASVVSGTISAQWITPITTATWSPFSKANTGTITGYTVTATDASGNVFTCSAAATANLCTVTGLANSTSYTVTLTATSSVGVSSVSNVLTVKTISATAAAAPVITGAVRNANGLAITWTAPASAGSGQLVGYFVTATDPLSTQQYTCGYNATYGLLLAPAVTCSIAGLTVGNSYNISVTAVTKDGAGATQLSVPATKTGVVYNTLAPEPVMATFLAVTAKQKSVSALSANAKTSLASLISSINDGAQITITGYGTTKAIALARANAAASYLFKNGAAVHVTVKSVISKTIKTALVTVTSN